MKSSNTKGNPNHDAQGRFSSSPSDGTKNGAGGKTTAPSSTTGTGGGKKWSWLQDASDTSTSTKPSQKWSWLTDSNDNAPKANSIWEQVQKERWWKSDELRDTQYVVDNIDKYYEDDMLDEIEKAGFHTADRNGSYFGTTRTSHSHINAILTNLVAKKKFNPITVLDNAQFDSEWNMAQKMNTRSYNNFPYVDTACVTRGVHKADDRLADSLGKTDNKLVLPNGMYGSCIYSAYDTFTARSYAGSSGVVMRYLIDNKNGHTITDTDYNVVSRDFKARLPEMEKNLRESLKKRGKDDTYCDSVVRQFHNTAMNDELFPALMLGYDCVYNTGAHYSLILNYKHVKTTKDW